EFLDGSGYRAGEAGRLPDEDLVCRHPDLGERAASPKKRCSSRGILDQTFMDGHGLAPGFKKVPRWRIAKSRPKDPGTRKIGGRRSRASDPQVRRPQTPAVLCGHPPVGLRERRARIAPCK